MSCKVLYGKPVSEHIKSELKLKIDELSDSGIIPKLSVILIGDNPASKIYVNSKHKTFINMNCKSEIHNLDKNVSEDEVVKLIDTLNNNPDVHGILIQLPAPPHLNEENIIRAINPLKDVDGLHPMNLGKLFQGKPSFIPCTPYGCLKILEYYEIETVSKNIVIIGRSNLVGKPLFGLLSQKFQIGNATVTLCHSRTKNIEFFTKEADIIIAAVGVPKLVKSNMIKDNCILIDVGINRIDDDSKKGYHIVGDIDFDSVQKKASAVTPVPGGVGVMTVTMLLYNTVNSIKV
ncbi:MAG: bifunctional 5,10-methylene-tetrahydrofolate dehydrogenase/5,10-methylene-tetrahydrofolate cyclohydrolase [Candidatus Marinimicrobia bacterium]|mgnify:FL=1|nr:bifunctional 5,10-methylene-tetrahydrofolate dehydrogenase/5,10-methylene-tetrahydrofolate cyclohydrolase [Candidatus Neomarinimicrobiota bacterium]|tara:strand:+ start:6731 stop:7600 length:870 start_codon:yes stop_codon:yes gene_type:complete